MAGKKLGKRAMFLGAIAQSVPDIDFIAGTWLNPAENLLAHRGFTHSFLFLLIIAPVLALLAERWHRPHNIRFRPWLLFFGLQGLIHLFIDGMNVYGVGWFEPFDHHRVAFNWIFVADPFFSAGPGIALVVLLFLRRKDNRRRWWARTGIIWSAVYLFYCGLNKAKIDSDAREIFSRQQIHWKDYFTTPTPLNNWLWYVVAATDSGYYIGYRSLFDRQRNIDFHFVARNEGLLEPVNDHEDLQKLIRFSKGFYTVASRKDTLVFSDIRFGEMIGWRDKAAPFVFYYYLRHPDQNQFLVQRGRFARWDMDAFWSLIKRIKGE